MGNRGGESSGDSAIVSTPPQEPAPAARLHKLTASQFTNSIHDLLGSGAPLGPVEPDTRSRGFTSVGASSVTISPSGVGQYEAAVGAATTWLFADRSRVAAVLPCLPRDHADTTCAARGLAAFGRRAFRRPLTDVETARFVRLATTIGEQSGGDILVGLRHTISTILQSPSFLYRVELGAPSAADGGRLKYTSFEMASRLASTLWNTLPDPALLDAAEKNSLATPDGIREQATRMLADPRARQGLAVLVADLFDLQNLEEADPDLAMYPMWTPSLRAAMQRDLEMRVEDVLLDAPADFLSLFDSRTVFVNNELAVHYGLPVAPTDGFRRAELPVDSPRAGILGSGAILAGLALPQRTAPTRRGKFIRETLLCQSIPPPPSDIPPLPPPTDPDATMRQRLAEHRKNPTCAACHARMDPLGFGLESFDSVGKYRATENGQPVDATGDLNGVPFGNLVEMATVLRNAPVTGPCFVSKVYVNALGRPAGSWDGPALERLAAEFAASGNRADQLLLSLVSSEAFRFVEPRTP